MAPASVEVGWELLQLCGPGSTARTWLVLQGNTGSIFGAAAHFMAELKFRVVEIDPTSGEVAGHQDGFREEYPLEDIEISTADFIAKVRYNMKNSHAQ